MRPARFRSHGFALLRLSCAVLFLQSMIAEWSLVPPLLRRTGWLPALVALGAVLLWLGRAADAPALAAVICAAFVPRDATLALAHAGTPLAVAAGRWVCIAAPATAFGVACTVAGGSGATDALAGAAAAAAVAGCALPVALLAGSTGLSVLFLLLALAGAAPPEDLVAMADPGIMRVAAASALELGPALWRYRSIAGGDLGGLVHAALWAAMGVLLASGLFRRAARGAP